MAMLRYSLKKDLLFYLFVIGYGYLIGSMSYGLWWTGEVNIFASYSQAASAEAMLLDANKVYWSKTCFLFGTLLLTGLRVDFRAASGLMAALWAGSLVAMFSITPVLTVVAILGVLLLIQQVFRGQVFSAREA